MISCSSTFASSAPATSAKVTFGVSAVRSFAFDFPNENALRAARLHLPEEEDPEADEQQIRQEVMMKPSVEATRVFGIDLHVVLAQARHLVLRIGHREAGW